MKRLILMVLVIAFAFPALAQKTNSLFESLTETYSGKDGFSASLLTKDLFDLYLKKRSFEETSPVSDALKKLDQVMVVSLNNFFSTGVKSPGDVKPDPDNEKLHQTLLQHYQGGGYTLLKTEKRMGEDVKVYLKKNQEKTEALALITSSSYSTNLIELKGDIDLKNVAELNKTLNLKGLENLYKLNSGGSAGTYAIGENFSQERVEEMVARQRELIERQRFLTDEQKQQFEKQAEVMALRQKEMAEKYREMAERYKREPIFLNYPGDTNTVYYLNGKKVKANEIKELEKDKIESIQIDKSGKNNDVTTIKIKTK